MAPTFQLSNITQSRISDSLPSPLFGLQDALNTKFEVPFSSFRNPSLFPNACNQTDGTHNCTTACLDPEQLFRSLDTLHDCLVWPSVNVNDADNKISPYATHLANTLGLKKGSDKSDLPSRISNNIQTCILDSCDENDQCKENANKAFAPRDFKKVFPANLKGEEYFGNGTNGSIGYFNPCKYINDPATADIAGIGV